MYVLQRKHWSYDSFVMWNELKAGSTDPIITISLSLETLLVTDDCFFSYWEKAITWLKKKKERGRSLTKSPNYRNLSEIFYLFIFVLSNRARIADYQKCIYGD